MWALLGDIEFSALNSFDSLDIAKSATYVEINVVNGKPKIQFCGTNLDTISVKISLHANSADIEAFFEKINQAFYDGFSMPLIFSNGDYLGDYFISDLRQVVQSTDSFGNINYCEYNLTLKENPISEEEKEQRKNEASRMNIQETNSATVINDPEISNPFLNLIDFIKSL